MDEKRILEILRDYYEESIFITDGEGVVVFANRVAEKRMNAKLENLLGSNVVDMVKGGMYEHSTTAQVLKTGQKTTGRIANNVYSNSVPVFDDKGNLEYVVTNNMNVEHNREWAKIIESNKAENKRLRRELDYMRLQDHQSFIANSPIMKNVLSTIEAVAPTDSSVVLLGESGTGKDVISKLIHEKSMRKDHTYLSVNCAAMPDTLLESELFGYEAGAFTGAQSGGKIGLFEATDGGTIFLDEIGEMSLQLQSKLLRVLENHDIRRVGGIKNISVDVRVICATNRDLEKMVEEGTFREDLYYRLSVFTIKLPPLSERREDILPIAQLFLDQLNQKYGTDKEFAQVSKETMLHYYWPGNIRELRNVVERLYVISKDNTLLFFNPAPVADIKKQLEYKETEKLPIPEFNTLKEFTEFAERTFIEKVMEECGGSVGKTAERLGIHRSALYRKLHKDSGKDREKE